MGNKKLNKCSNCGGLFDPGKHKEKKTCSKECLKEHRDRIKNERIRRSKEGMKEKYNVDHPSKLPDFSDRVKKTKKRKYGDENFNNRKKAKDTNIKKYGVENTMKFNEIKNKTKRTKKEKYGNENFNNRNKAKLTIKRKTGESHHLRTERSLEKLKKTNKAKYNKDYTVQLDKAKERAREEISKKYNADNFFSSKEHKNRLKKEKEEKLKHFLENNDLEMIDQYKKMREKNINDKNVEYITYRFKCKNCENIFESTFSNKNIVCRNCYPLDNGSILQREVVDFIKELNIDLIENDRRTISPFELDVFIPEKKLAIEINGNYFHSENFGGKGKNYHIKKSIESNIKGIKLIHIFEDEWLFKKDVVKSKLKNELGIINRKIGARKCIIKEIESKEKRDFLFKNHLKGNSNDKVRFGTFYKNELISVMTFSKKRVSLGNKNKENEWELIRFCHKNDMTVIGGFKKMLDHFIKKYEPLSIIAYADCRWSGIDHEKVIYNDLFDFIKRTRPNYFRISEDNFLDRKHRFSLNKQRLLKEFGGDPNKTEDELAKKNGFDKIWDCGSLKFVWNSH